MHVLDLKPFQVGLGHIGLIGHHGVKLVWPFLLIILFQALNTRRAKGERHQKHASINSFIQLVTMNHIVIDVNSSKTIISLCIKNLLLKPMFLINKINKFTCIYCCIIWWPPNESFSLIFQLPNGKSLIIK
jgi:hypothetical protein